MSEHRSQTARIMDVLGDGNPHSVREIHALAGTSRLNSRIADLRPRVRAAGFDIVCEHVGGTGPDAYHYQLVEAA